LYRQYEGEAAAAAAAAAAAGRSKIEAISF